ncbi:MAG: GAF domain-containing protein [Myxococcota bacterium]
MARNALKTDPGSLVTGLASHLAELERSVARQGERFAALIEIGAEISRARDVETLLATVMERLTGLLGAEAATLFMYDEATGELWSRMVRGTAVKEIRFDAGLGIAGHVFRTGKTLLLGDAYSDIRFNPEIDKKTGFRTRSVIATPLKHLSGKVQGVLQVLDRRIDVFNAEDRALVEGVASQVAAVLDHVLLVEELKARGGELARRVHDLDVLFEIEQAISGTDAQQDLLDRILARAAEVTGAKAGSVLLVEDDRDSLFFRSARGEKSDALKAVKLKAGQGIAGFVAASGQVVRVADANASEHFDRGLAKKLGYPVGAVLCVPISAQGRILGALELLNKPDGFTAGDERLAVLLAGQVGRALVLRQSREEAERKARLAAIGQLMAGVLHDLRTPLTVIAGYAEMMASENDAETRAEMSRAILSQLENVSAMQQETLAFARGERTVFLRKVYLQVFMDDLSEQLQQEFAGTDIECKVNVGYTGLGRFDETKLRRAIFNLARNAIDAMPDGGRFVVSVEREGDELVFRAQDNGPGIPPEIADRLFESFVSSGKKHGTGLGLAIVRKIAQEHGGSVTCKTKIGKGSTFEIRIPAGTPRD